MIKCFMKLSFLTSRIAQNPGFKKEAATRVIINKMKTHPLQRFQGQMLHFHVDSLTALQVEGDSQGKKHMTAKQRRCWGNWAGKIDLTFSELDLIYSLKFLCLPSEKRRRRSRNRKVVILRRRLKRVHLVGYWWIRAPKGEQAPPSTRWREDRRSELVQNADVLLASHASYVSSNVE